MERKIILQKVQHLLERPVPLLQENVLRNYVESFLSQREVFLRAARDFGSPLYIFDEAAIVRKGREFQSVFSSAFPRSKCFYAMKSNSHPFLLRTLVDQGFYLDVSSGWELEMALAQSPREIIFSGPAKTEEELRLACRHADKVTVLLDSFAELARLEKIADQEKVVMRAGVRLMIEEKGLWRKFGIPLRRLEEFFTEARKQVRVNVRGLQFHASWNLDPAKQVSFLKRLGQSLQELSAEALAKIEFIDIGGGYWPAAGEWVHSGATPEGRLWQCLEPRIDEGLEHRCFPATPLGDFARQIRAAFQEFIEPWVQTDIYLEPGRWISNGSMHILLRVEDVKAEDVVITDGATSAVGWERYETDYCPVLNLSCPSLQERPCTVFGSLCTPHDLWGYSVFGETITQGDLLLIPDQGAYTYSLRQHFIKPLPDQVILGQEGLRRFEEKDCLK